MPCVMGYKRGRREEGAAERGGEGYEGRGRDGRKFNMAQLVQSTVCPCTW